MSEEVAWIQTESGYEVALIDGKLACKNAKGKQLKSVSKAVKETPEAEQLLALRDWLKAHEATCREAVASWMQRSLPVPRELLASVWRDATWRSALENMVVHSPSDEASGFFRGVGEDGKLGIVNLDGETEWLNADALYIPHPILIEELDDVRELATDLGISQSVSQLFRDTWTPPADLDSASLSIGDFENGKFEALNHVLGKCRTLGYRVSGGFATCTVWEGGKTLEARFWIGADSPEEETYTGELNWVDSAEHALKLGDVGPVAFSEGMRMASSIFAARVVEKAGEEA